jgi:predicted PP-loop superfamily ATPase
MSKLKNTLKSPFVHISIILSLVAILIVASAISESKFGHSEALTVILAIAGIFVTIRLSLKKKEVQEIRDFKLLHNSMTDEMEKMLKDKSKTEKHLYILSFTPAFGNISTPKLYENNENPIKTYKHLLGRIVEEKKEAVDVKIICYDKNKRNEYHKNWAKVYVKDNEAEQEKCMEKWEEQATEIIKIVRDKHGYNSVMEVDHMHPILFFSSNNMLIQYAIKMGSTEKKESEVFGTIFHQESGKNFFWRAFKEYKEYYEPGKIVQLYEDYFKEEDKYIKAADYVKRVLDGKAAEKEVAIDKMNILLAYGGGKDSTMVLIFLKYVQELFLKETKTTFMLHILTHVHLGMRESVFQNIHNVFKKLELHKDNNVKIVFQTKGHLLDVDVKKFIENNFDSGKISIPDNIKTRFKREILLLGHLSKGLGRHTFCYTCNIDMIMSIINYTRDQENKIDFVITGDTKKEQQAYTKWLNKIFTFIAKKGVDIKHDKYDTKSFFSNFDELQNFFKNDIGIENHEPNETTIIQNYPELFDIHKYIEFSLTSFKLLLEDELGFSFHENSFNFSETDCFYPAIMAHMAGLRGGKNYEAHLKLYFEHVEKIMNEKKFPSDLINQGRTSFNINKVSEIEKFLLNKLGISKKQLEALIYSPFLDNGKRLQSFLNEHNINLKGSKVIDYINGATSVGKEKEEIDKFIDEWIGLSNQKDIKRILKYSEKPKSEDEVLEVIASGDPYIRNYPPDGGTVTISGR